VKGGSRNEFSSEQWLKEEERSGEQDMNCAAAATEISQQLEKCPVILLSSSVRSNHRNLHF
jgi:hypothetical protein